MNLAAIDLVKGNIYFQLAVVCNRFWGSAS